MNVDELINKNKLLEEENAKLMEKLKSTQEHLKKYTAPASRQLYYEKNKEVIKERVKKYIEDKNYKPTPEQKKEYNKQSYLKRKEKLKNEIEEKSKNENI
jgi:hypothetical protein